jgi:mRNA interferase MazF
MGKPLVGEVVVLPFPQTNLQAGKRRPALVVADLPGDDLILCQITSQSRNDGQSVPLPVADFERGRLALDSFIRPQRLFTVEQSVILYAAGKIKNTGLQEVRTRLRQLFAWPASRILTSAKPGPGGKPANGQPENPG